MEGENVTGYRLGMSHAYTALRNKPAFIASVRLFDRKVPGSILGRGMETF